MVFMGFKKYFNLTNFLIFICVCLIIYFSINMGSLFIEVKSNQTLTVESKLDAVSIYSTLIVLLVSIISLSINTRYTQISLNQTNDLIEENRKDLFVQLRYADAKMAMDKLDVYLASTFGVYHQLVLLHNSDNPEKGRYLSPRAFLVLQYINIISNDEMLFGLPITFKKDIESKFIDLGDGSILETIYDVQKFNELLGSLGFVDDYQDCFNIIKSMDWPEKAIQNFFSYQSSIKEFNSQEDYELQESVFRYYYGLKNIKTEDFYKHFVDIYNTLKFHSIGELILRDYDLYE